MCVVRRGCVLLWGWGTRLCVGFCTLVYRIVCGGVMAAPQLCALFRAVLVVCVLVFHEEYAGVGPRAGCKAQWARLWSAVFIVAHA